MSLSRFLSTISLVAAAGSTGCSDDSCGPGGAPDVGLVASGSAVTLTYGHLTSGPNNDCLASDAPAGVISMTLQGIQTDGAGRITLCVGRPDRFADQALALGFAASSPVQVIDFAGAANSCTLAIDRATPPTGTASASGLCGNGDNPAGFALVLDAAVTLTRTCGTTVDAVAVTLRGRVAVASPSR